MPYQATNTKKVNPNCSVAGCRTKTPHAKDPIAEALIQEFGPPEKMTRWALAAMAELRDSICRDLVENKVLAWYTRLRQPEEIYVTVLYALFIADEKELHHIISGETPNGFSRLYPKVNEVILGGRGLLQVSQAGASSGTFKPIDMLHAGAHVSFPAFMTCIGISRDPSARPSPDVYAKHLNTYCTYLDYMRGMFEGGKAKEHVLDGVISLHKPASPLAEAALTCARASKMNESHQCADLIARLRAAGATGVDEYALKLKANEKNEETFHDLFFEGKAALMFLDHRWQVELRDRPDLKLQFAGELLYAEVKHFRRKELDLKDEEAMRAATNELVRYGDLGTAEGFEAWEQVVMVAKRKAGQYVEGSPNILLVESSTVSLELMATSAVHAIDDACESGDLGLCRLSGFVLVDASGWTSFGTAQRDVEFCKTSHAVVPLSENLCRALDEIRS